MKHKNTVFLSIAIISLSITSCNIGKYFQQRYYRNTYNPTYLTNQNKFSYPDEYHIKGIPCISYQNAYCASAAFQMIAEQKGNNKSIDYINWLMGFTYSFYFMDKNCFALPYYDPEAGYANAASYLGLKRNYLVTSDSLI